MKLLLFLLGLSAVVVSEFLHRSGQEYVYSYSGTVMDMYRNPSTNKDVFSALVINCKVVVQAESTLAGPQQKLKIALKDVRMDDIRKNVDNPYSDEWRHIAINATSPVTGKSKVILETPFEVELENGSVRKVILSSMETVWSANLKKSLLSSLKMNLPIGGSHQNLIQRGLGTPEAPQTWTWTVREKGIDGECDNTYRVTQIPEVDPRLVRKDLCPRKKFFEVVKSRDLTKCHGRSLFLSASQHENCLQGACTGPHTKVITKYFGCGHSIADFQLHSILDDHDHNSDGFKDGSIHRRTKQLFLIDSHGDIIHRLPTVSSPKSTDNLVYQHHEGTTLLQKSSSLSSAIWIFSTAFCQCLQNPDGCYIDPSNPAPQGYVCRCSKQSQLFSSQEICHGDAVKCSLGEDCPGNDSSLAACQAGARKSSWWIRVRSWFRKSTLCCGGYRSSGDTSTTTQIPKDTTENPGDHGQQLLLVLKEYILNHVGKAHAHAVEVFGQKLKKVTDLKSIVFKLFNTLMEHRSCNNTASQWEMTQKLRTGLGLACGLPNPGEMLDTDYLLSLADQVQEANCLVTQNCHSSPGFTFTHEPICDPYQLVRDESRPLTCPAVDMVVQELNPGHWKEDSTFVNNFINGMNPMVIRKVQSLEEIPQAMHKLTSTHSGSTETVFDLQQQRKLFIADYSILTGVPVHFDRPIYSPVVLMSVHAGQLRPLAILLNTSKTSSRPQLLTPASLPNRWLFAKMHVALADAQVHQFAQHLPVHLMMETVAVASHNHIHNHFIGKLLEPHFKGTILINFATKNTLLSWDTLTEKAFTVGLQGAFDLGRKSYNFTNLDFPKQMAMRGFPQDKVDGISNFHYRDDGYKIWNILSPFIGSMVSHHYHSDQAVQDDQRLQQWAASIAGPDKGNFPDFPERIETRHQLARILTTLVFTASVQHQALNAPQTLYSYVPQRPTMLNQWMPEGEEDLDDSFMESALPTRKVVKKISKVVNILTKQSLCTIADGTGSGLTEFFGRSDEEVAYLLSRLRRDLNSLSEAIQKRVSTQSQAAAYPYLDPRMVACSVDI